MLYKLQNNIFICCLLVFCAMACWLHQRSLDLMVAGSLVAFVSQMALMLYFSKLDRSSYSEKALFVVVLLYSLMLGTIFMAISYIYDGDTFMFNKSDALLYYKDSIRAYDVGLLPNLQFIMNLKSATIIQYTIKGRFMSR